MPLVVLWTVLVLGYYKPFVDNMGTWSLVVIKKTLWIQRDFGGQFIKQAKMIVYKT